MGKKKWCFGREDVICMTKDCPYMSACIQVVWRRKMARLIGKGAMETSGTLPTLKTTLKREERAERQTRKRAASSR